jgi:AraC-like DNA-binding protein
MPAMSGVPAQLLIVMRSSVTAERRFLVVQLSAGEVDALLESGTSALARIPLAAFEIGADEIAEHIAERLGIEPSTSVAAGDTYTPRRRQHRHLEAALAYVEDNLHDPRLTPSRVAEGIHVSPRYLHAIFRGTGTTVAQHIRLRRLETGRTMLADPSLSGLHIADVARRVGFTDPSHFTRVFKNAYGHTPRQFRSEALRPQVSRVAPGRPNPPPRGEKPPSKPVN